MATTLDSLQLRITADTSTAVTAIETLNKSLKKLGGGPTSKGVERAIENMRKLGEATRSLTSNNGSMSEFGKAMTSLKNLKLDNTKKNVNDIGKGLNVASLNAFTLVGNLKNMVTVGKRIVDMVAPYIDEAANFEGIGERFMRGYQEYAEETYGWFQRLNTEMGLNVQRMMQYSSIYAQMLQGMGVSNQKDIASISTGLTELGYDIWAAYNDVYGSYEDVSAALKSGLAGQVRPLRQAGFDITNAALERTAAMHGLDVTMSNLTQAEKTYLRYQTLVDQAMQQGIVGTYAKEMETAEGVMRTLAQETRSLGQAFGSLFLPLLTKAIPIVTGFVQFLTDAVRHIAGLFGIQLQVIDFADRSFGAVTGFGDEMTESLEEAGGAAKELQKSILGFDELNVLSASASSSGGGGGGGGGGTPDVSGALASLDVSSLWTDAIFENVSHKANEVRDAIKEWVDNLDVMSILIGTATGAGILGALSLLAGHSKNFAANMALAKDIIGALGVIAITAGINFELASDFAKTENVVDAIGQLLVSGSGGLLAYAVMRGGGKGAVAFGLTMATSVVLEIIGFSTQIAKGNDVLSGTKIKEGIVTALQGAAAGAALTFGAGMLSAGTGAGAGAAVGAAGGPIGILAGAALGFIISKVSFDASISAAEEKAMQTKLDEAFGNWLQYKGALTASVSTLELDATDALSIHTTASTLSVLADRVNMQFGEEEATVGDFISTTIGNTPFFSESVFNPGEINAITSAIPQMWTNIYKEIEKGAVVPASTVKAAAEVWEVMKPSASALMEARKAAREAGEACPISVREGLTNAAQLGALANDADSIAWLIGQELSQGTEYLNMLATVEGAGAAVPKEVAAGILDNIGIINDPNTGAMVGIRNTITGETIAMTPILAQNMQTMGVTMVDYLYNENTATKIREVTGKIRQDVVKGVTISGDTATLTVVSRQGESIVNAFYNGADVQNRKLNWRKIIDDAVSAMFPKASGDAVNTTVTQNGTTIVNGLFESVHAEIESQNWSLIGAKLSDKIASGMYTPTLTVNAKLKFSEAGLSMREDPLMKNKYYISQMYATGGMPTSGEIFMARENGMPEYVGSMGNRTAVANNDQIVEGIAQGVSDANEAQNALLREQNRLLAEILNQGATSGGGGTSSQDVVAALTRANQRAGRTIVNVGV